MTRRAVLVLLGCTLAGLSKAAAAAAPPQPTSFGGKVLRVLPDGSFVMQRGASKLHPEATVRISKKTKWTGAARPDHKVQAGDKLVVTGIPAKGDRINASEIRIKDSNEHPAAHSGAAGPRH